MTALDYSAPAIRAKSRTIAAMVRFGDRLAVLVRSLKNQGQLDYLATMSDRQLADIGLMRGDIEVVGRGAFGTDPTTRLSELAQERYRIEENMRRVG